MKVLDSKVRYLAGGVRLDKSCIEQCVLAAAVLRTGSLWASVNTGMTLLFLYKVTNFVT